MPHSTYPERDYRFGLSILALRTASHLTQSALANRLGVSRQTIAGWESGTNYPSPVHLLHLIELCLQYQVFHPGQEAGEIRELWESAQQSVPLDETWLAHLLEPAAKMPAAGMPAAEMPLPGAEPDQPAPRVDWGDAPEVASFYGREAELKLLTGWLLEQRCRVVSILGMGGIGKTSLTARLVQEVVQPTVAEAPQEVAAPSVAEASQEVAAPQKVARHFERAYWRSLRDAPSPSEWLSAAIGFLSDQQVIPPAGDSERLAALLQLLRARRCLLVLDNFETLFEPGQAEGRYRSGMAGYGRLLRALGESGHQSCLVLTSRETVPELAILGGEAVRAFPLGGLGIDEAQRILSSKALIGSPEQWAELTARFGGNGLALKLVGERIRELFGGDIGLYLAEAGDSSLFGGVRRLLAEQVERSTAAEQQVLRALAVSREPVQLAELLATLGPRLGREAVLDALEALRRRSLVERAEAVGAAAFTLQSVVLEYVTDRLVEAVTEEIVTGQTMLLVEQVLIQALARDYMRQSQERLIGAPILAQLKARLGVEETERRLLALLADWRDRPAEEQGYGPGNSINLLRQLRGHLRGLDLTSLAIRQAYLAEVDAQDASLSGARLAESVLADAFGLPVAVALSGDSALLAVGTSTGQVWLWRVADRTLLATFEGDAGQVFSVALAFDGRLLASGSADGLVRLWEVSSKRLVATLVGHTSTVFGVTFSNDCHLVASSGQDGTVRLWEAPSGRPLATLEGHTGGVWGIALSADGRLVASSGLDGTVRLWEAPSGRPLATLAGHTSAVWGVALSADGQLLASGSLDGTVRLWETAGGQPLAIIQAHASGVWNLAFSVDGDLLASSGADGTIRVWETPSGQPLAALQGHSGGVRGLAISSTGAQRPAQEMREFRRRKLMSRWLLASGGMDGTVRLWEAPSGQPQATLQGQTGGVWKVAISSNGNLLASSGGDGTVRLWEMSSGRLVANIQSLAAEVRVVTLSADGSLLISGGLDGTVRLWEVPTGRLLATLEGHTNHVWGVALSANGRLLASGSLDGTVRLWEVPGGRPLATLRGHTGAVRDVALSADGRLLASGSADGTVRLWEAPSGRPLATLEGHSSAVWGVALSADGRLLASGGLDGTIRLWETASGRPLATIQAHSSPIWGIALTSDGHLVASASMDGTARLWETASERRLATLRGHAGPVPAAAFSTDGQILATGGWDGTVQLWEAPSGAHLRTLRAERRYERLNITGLTGITEAQRGALLALGAVEGGEGSE